MAGSQIDAQPLGRLPAHGGIGPPAWPQQQTRPPSFVARPDMLLGHIELHITQLLGQTGRNPIHRDTAAVHQRWRWLEHEIDEIAIPGHKARQS